MSETERLSAHDHPLKANAANELTRAKVSAFEKLEALFHFDRMGAVVEDRGAWEDASQYIATEQYVRFNAIQRLFYPVLSAISNRKIEMLRASMA